MNAQEAADIGDHLRELEETEAECAYNRYRQERDQYLRELTERFPDHTYRDDYEARMAASAEFVLWDKANRVPEPPVRQRPYKPLAVVGRGYRSGPLTDG